MQPSPNRAMVQLRPTSGFSMRLTSLTDHRPSTTPQLDLMNPQGQFFLNVEAYRLSRPSKKLPSDLADWPDAVCYSVVMGMIQDVLALDPEERFFEASAAYVSRCAPMVDDGPWGLQMGPLHLSMMSGAKDNVRAPATEPARALERHFELELEPDEGDAPLSKNPDVARTQAKMAWEAQPEPKATEPVVPLYQRLTQDRVAGLVRNLQRELQARELGPVVAFVAAGMALSMEAVMARLDAEESEVTFSNVQREDGTHRAISLLLFRDKPKLAARPGGRKP